MSEHDAGFYRGYAEAAAPRDAEIARLTALLAEAKIEAGLLAAMVPARAFSKKSDAEYIEAMGERARAILAKLGA